MRKKGSRVDGNINNFYYTISIKNYLSYIFNLFHIKFMSTGVIKGFFASIERQLDFREGRGVPFTQTRYLR